MGRLVIVKVQLPLFGGKEILIYDESREFCGLVHDVDRCREIAEGQSHELKAFWLAEVDMDDGGFSLLERIPDQEW